MEGLRCAQETDVQVILSQSFQEFLNVFAFSFTHNERVAFLEFIFLLVSLASLNKKQIVHVWPVQDNGHRWI